MFPLNFCHTYLISQQFSAMIIIIIIITRRRWSGGQGRRKIWGKDDNDDDYEGVWCARSSVCPRRRRRRWRRVRSVLWMTAINHSAQDIYEFLDQTTRVRLSRSLFFSLRGPPTPAQSRLYNARRCRRRRRRSTPHTPQRRQRLFSRSARAIKN